MSLENDARNCLIEAVRRANNVTLEPGDLNVAKPSDPDFQNDMIKWRRILEDACSCLSDKGYHPDTPTNAEAGKLLDKTMSHSLAYLIKLARTTIKITPMSIAAGAAVIMIGTAIVASSMKRR
jgi:hypothetical protein